MTAPRRCGHERHYPPVTLQLAVRVNKETALDAHDSLKPRWHALVTVIACSDRPHTTQRVFAGTAPHRWTALQKAMANAVQSTLGDSP